VATPRKDERLYVRVTAKQAAVIRQAAEAQGRTMTDFILDSATERAEELLVDRRSFVASPEAWDQFVAALDAPAEPVPALVELFTDPDLRA
jgi:uncharacterized protein (DUF1778 family)